MPIYFGEMSLGLFCPMPEKLKSLGFEGGNSLL